MKIDFFSYNMTAYNPINSLVFSYSVFIFYLLPFIVLSNQKIQWSNFNFLFSVVFLIISVLFFSYSYYANGIEHAISTGGGIFYGVNKLLFDINLL